jgi:predicted glutamine amidotransferase
MCGIFAYAGTAAPDPELLALAAAEAARRGPHGYGWGYRQPDGSLHVYRQLGPLNGDIRKITQIGAGAVIGHARLATQGAMCTDSSGLQPVTADGHLLAHNGNIYNPGDLADPGYATDSAALAAQYADRRAAGLPPAGALTLTMVSAVTPASAVVILDASGVMLAWRRRLPLYLHENDNGRYLSSRPFAGAVLLPEHTVINLGAGS